jgi:hypothetical protein
MSNHDQDLVTDLISGRLSPQERRRALARLAEDPALRAAYENQLAVASLLGDAPAPIMTPEERSALRASLVQRLHLDAPPAAVPTPPSRWQRWWVPATGLAAAAAVIIGAVVILPGGGSDDAANVASANFTTTTAAAERFGRDGGEAAEQDVLSSTDAAAATPPPPTETTTTAAAAGEPTTTLPAGTEELAPVAGDVQTGALPYIQDVDLERLDRAFAAGGEAFDAELSKSTSASAPVDPTAAVLCLETSDAAPSAASELEVIATATIDGIDAVLVAVVPPDAEPYLVALDAASCRVLASTGP